MSSGSFDPAAIEAITRQVIARLGAASNQTPSGPAPRLSERAVPVGVSVRHVHIAPEHLQILFGDGYQLQPRNELYQKGEFAATAAVTLVGPRMRCMDSVRILGPTRKRTQIELSRTDCIYLGVDAPVRPSGNHEGTPGIIIVGPVGVVHLEQGVIRANRHMHVSDVEAGAWGLQDNGICAIRIHGEKKTVFEDVQVRVNPSFRAEMHLDTDDSNAAGVSTGDLAEIL